MPTVQPVTIVDVARRAGVSAGTVSNVLTGKRPVAEATRVRILRAIEELGYQPNLLARSLVNRSSNTLGVVTSGLEYYGPSRTLVGIEAQANELGYSLLLDLLHRPDVDDVAAILDDLTARRVDGIIWAVHEVGGNRHWIAPERLRALPPIVFLTMKSRPGTSILSTDNRTGALLATQHLIDLGRRKIALVAGPQDWWEARERLAGWQAALEGAALDVSSRMIVYGDWMPSSGEQALRRLLEAQPDIDGVFASNDQMALGVLRACHFLHRRVPDDIAVVGFDNMPEAEFLWPSLTSVRQRLTELGRGAVQTLHSAIEARGQGSALAPGVQLLTPELVVRESTIGRND
ncbi:MAG: LacI family DNA-binding transcriptional regulator [Anaerolineales bacterium]|nr:LacI family DNA-binding transcriptional regulator [Anaerolineales bacterium]